MNSIVDEQREASVAAIEHLKAELASIRSNRVHPSMAEDVKVDAYGSIMRLKELASLAIPEPRTLVVQPWDKSLLKDIERAFQQANLNLGISNDGAVIRLTMPVLTAESRTQLVKVVHQKLEAARVQLRQIREKGRERIVAAERDKAMTEDDRFKAQEDLDALVREFTSQVNDLGQRKEEEVTTI